MLSSGLSFLSGHRSCNVCWVWKNSPTKQAKQRSYTEGSNILLESSYIGRFGPRKNTPRGRTPPPRRDGVVQPGRDNHTICPQVLIQPKHTDVYSHRMRRPEGSQCEGMRGPRRLKCSIGKADKGLTGDLIARWLKRRVSCRRRSRAH